MLLTRMIRGAIRGVRQELTVSGDGWSSLGSRGALEGTSYSSTAGQTVSASSVLQVSAVWDCVKKTSQLVGSLPVSLYERTDDEGGKRRIDTDLAGILTLDPNPGQTAMEFWEGMVAQTVLRGNGFAERLFVGNRLVGLRPIFGVTPTVRPDGRIEYEVNDRGRRSKMPAEKIFHLRGFGSGDGLGLSAIRYGANSMGAALASDETAGKVFSNQMMAAGVLKSDQTLNAAQREQIAGMLQSYVGSSRAGKLLVLEAGLDFKQLQMNPEDAQLLETRRFGVEDVCRWFGVPPIVIGHASEGQTMWGSGVEAIMLSWLTLGINPLLRRIEARVLKDLVPREKRRKWFLEWNREAMLQMDSAAKAEFLSKMASSATMTANERRSKLNLRKHEDPTADDLLAQGAMVTLGSLGKAET